MQPITLSPRMNAIVQHVGSASTLADIGTDHAFIPIYTVQTGLVHQAIATDLRSGPLAKARSNVQRYGLESRIDLRLGDGLAPLRPGEVDTIVTAGIGGHVHAMMLVQQPEVALSAQRMVFQPMNAGHVLRQHLYQFGFTITEESLVMDDDRIYEIIVAHFEDVNYRDPLYDPYIDDAEALQAAYTFGATLLQKPTELFRMRVDRLIDKHQSIAKRVQAEGNVGVDERIAELSEELRKLENLKATLWK